jgi:hypothetical protein
MDSQWKFPIFLVTVCLVALAVFGAPLGKEVPIFSLFVLTVLAAILLTFLTSKAWRTGIILSRAGPVKKSEEPTTFYFMFAGTVCIIALVLLIATILLLSLIR